MAFRGRIVADANGRPAPVDPGVGITGVDATAPLILSLVGTRIVGSIDPAGIVTGTSIQRSGLLIGKREHLNLIPGANVSIAAVDNPGAGRVDVTFAATGLLSGLTSGYLPRASGVDTVVNSPLFTDGTSLGLGTETPTDALHIRRTGSRAALFLDGQGAGGYGALKLESAANTSAFLVSAGNVDGDGGLPTGAGFSIRDTNANVDRLIIFNSGIVDVPGTLTTGGTQVSVVGHTHGGVYQPADAELTAIAGLVSAADRLPYFTGAGTAALATFTAAGRNLLDDASTSDQRTTLGLGTLATQNANNVSITGGAISGVTLSASSVTATGLTSGRIPVAGTGGLLGNSPVYTDGTNVGVGTAYTPGTLTVAATAIAGMGGNVVIQNYDGSEGSFAALRFNVTASGPDAYQKGSLIYRANAQGYGRGDFHFLQNVAADANNASLADAVVTIKSSGNVLIGTTTSTGAKLEVNGDIKATAIKLTTGASNGYVLTSDADGDATWQAFTGGMTYKGTWNANTNSPTLADGTGTAGDTYAVAVSGTQFSRSFTAGGWAIYNGSIWEPVGTSVSVTSVNGLTGAVSLGLASSAFVNQGTTTQVLHGNASGNPSWGAVSLTADVSGTLPLGNGGTGQTTAQAAMNTLAGAVTSGQYLRGNGTNVVMSAIQAADVPTLNQNTTGTAAGLSATLAGASGGTGRTTNPATEILYGGAGNAVTSSSRYAIVPNTGATHDYLKIIGGYGLGHTTGDYAVTITGATSGSYGERAGLHLQCVGGADPLAPGSTGYAALRLSTSSPGADWRFSVGADTPGAFEIKDNNAGLTRLRIAPTTGIVDAAAGLTVGGTAVSLTGHTHPGLLSGLTSGYLPRASSTTALVNSPLYTDGTKVGLGIGATVPAATLEARGSVAISDAALVAAPTGPLTIVSTDTSLAIGQNAGLRINAGLAPSVYGSPGSTNSVIAAQIVAENVSIPSANLWGLNVIAMQHAGYTADPSSTKTIAGPATINGIHQVGIEVEVCNTATAENYQADGLLPYNLYPTAGKVRSNGIEVLSHSLTAYRNAAALMVYSGSPTETKWWEEGLTLSRVFSYGVRFRKLAGDGADPFQTALLDASSLTRSPQTLLKCPSDAGTDYRIVNAANWDVNLSLDSGAGTEKECLFGFRNNGTAAWWVGKNYDGRFQILNGAKSLSAFAAEDDAGTMKLAFFGGIAPAAKPAVTGSRGGNAALASLLTALANLGLITNSTTA